MPEPRPLRCHRCGSADLDLWEVTQIIGKWRDGLLLTGDGKIAARGEADFFPGSIQPELTSIECGDCGHVWHPRRAFDGQFAESP